MRRLLATPLLVLALLAPVHAAQDAHVTIALPDGGERSIPLAALGEPDVEAVRYALRAAGGGTSELTVTGWSLAHLLDEAELDGLTHVLVARPDGTDVLVLREQVVQQDDRPPVVWADEQGMHLLRPSANEDDVNAEDLATAADGRLVVRVRQDLPFKVRIEASALRVRPNRPIRLTARLVVGELAEDMTFRWYFGDGTARARGAHVTHRFANSGVYPVQVNLWKGAWELEAADIAYVRVAAPRPVREDEPEEDAPAATAGGSDPAPQAPAAPPAPAPLPADPAPQGELVSGTLLASADPAPAPEGASGPRGRHRAAPADEPLHVPIGVWIVAGLAVLVAAGWALEARHTAPFWQT